MLQRLTILMTVLAAGFLGTILTGCGPKQDPLQIERHETTNTTTTTETRMIVE